MQEIWKRIMDWFLVHFPKLAEVPGPASREELDYVEQVSDFPFLPITRKAS